jgi:hypothetical protein
LALKGLLHGLLEVQIYGQTQAVARDSCLGFADGVNLPACHIYFDQLFPILPPELLLECILDAGEPYQMPVRIITLGFIGIGLLSRDRTDVAQDMGGQSTYCAACGSVLIERNWYELGTWNLRSGACGDCGAAVPGRFDERPGTWGSRRMPVAIRGV